MWWPVNAAAQFSQISEDSKVSLQLGEIQDLKKNSTDAKTYMVNN